MKRVANGGLWLPDNETDAVMIGAGAHYQSNKLFPAIRYVKNVRAAIDVGAHCGLWTVQLGNYFKRVECFEPLPLHIECWKRNAGWKKSCILHETALGDQTGTCGITTPDGFSGRSYVDGDGEYSMSTLDSFGFEDIDLIKIDCEGYEYYVCKGAEKTITSCKPIIVVEQKKGLASRYRLDDTEAVKYLRSLGMTMHMEIAGDYIMGWPD